MINYIKSIWHTSKIAIGTFFILIRVSFKKLGIRILFADFFSVSSSIGFVIVPSFIFGICLLVIPQGRDAFLLVAEKMIAKDFRPFVGLLIGICGWSYASELAVRYAIAISDNSGLNLSDDRVKWRKTVQRILAAFFLLFPFFVVLWELVRLIFVADYISMADRIIYLGSAIVALLLIMSFTVYLYFYKIGNYGPYKPRRTRLGKRSLPLSEQNWLDKLYGIYNDYIFSFPKASSFKKPYKDEFNDFVDGFDEGTSVGLNEFPQNPNIFDRGRLVPQEFLLLNKDKADQRGYLYKWIYQIPPSFYKGFHQQVKVLAVACCFLLLSVAFIPAEWPFFTWFGAPGLICLAFACYTGIYVGLLYLDKTMFRKWKLFSLRALLIIILLTTSYFNQDHPVRHIAAPKNRVAIADNFSQWFTQYKDKFGKKDQRDTVRLYPVIFICAEGGAFRTGAYTGLFLSKIEQVLAEGNQHIDFRNSIFAMSGVSGGAVGLGYYNAVAFQRDMPVGKPTVSKAEEFFTHDSLSPLIGKMLFGEFINLFIPISIERFDRAIALEKTWEKAYQETFNEGENLYKKPFIASESTAVKPVFIINTTEVETGLQCWVSNYSAKEIRFSKERDLLAHRMGNMSYSTAINFSSRFPLFSPAATVKEDKQVGHFVDGGYVENTGSASMLELLRLIKQNPVLSKQIVPVVITLQFAPDEDVVRPKIKWFNELSEIVLASYNTRSGRTKTSRHELKDFVKEWNDGLFIDAPFRSKDVPMNWVLSNKSMKEVVKNVNAILNENDGVMGQFFDARLNYLHLKSAD